MDELYSSLPLEKVESLEDLVTIGPPGLVKVNYLSCNTSFARAFFFFCGLGNNYNVLLIVCPILF